MTMPMTGREADRFHAACKMIELDGCEGYFTCRERFGPDVAGAALVMWLRSRIHYQGDVEEGVDYWDNLKNSVNDVLLSARRMTDDR